MPNLTSSFAAGQASPAEVRPRPGPDDRPTIRIFDPTEPPGPPPPGPPPGPPPERSAELFGKALASVARDAGLSPLAKQLLSNLKILSFEQGLGSQRICFPDFAGLAVELGRNVGHVNRAVRDLERAGKIERQWIARGPETLGRNRLVRLLDEPEPEPDAPDHSRAGARPLARRRASLPL